MCPLASPLIPVSSFSTTTTMPTLFPVALATLWPVRPLSRSSFSLSLSLGTQRWLLCSPLSSWRTFHRKRCTCSSFPTHHQCGNPTTVSCQKRIKSSTGSEPSGFHDMGNNRFYKRAEERCYWSWASLFLAQGTIFCNLNLSLNGFLTLFLEVRSKNFSFASVMSACLFCFQLQLECGAVPSNWRTKVAFHQWRLVELSVLGLLKRTLYISIFWRCWLMMSTSGSIFWHFWHLRLICWSMLFWSAPKSVASPVSRRRNSCYFQFQSF